MSWADNYNNYIMNQWTEKATEQMSDDDMDVVDDFMQFVSGDPSAASRIAANIANSIVPLGGARNDLGNLLSLISVN